jgi:uncharacterized DUF497 family protein
MKLDWDPDKDKLNWKKHKISFEEAAKVFDDPLQVNLLDHRIDANEERWITMGQIFDRIIVVVAHTVMNSHGEELIRIISARQATARERRQYENIQH